MVMITRSVYNCLLQDLTLPPPEVGGILGEVDGVICKAEHIADVSGERLYGTYTPDIKQINWLIKNWEKRGVKFCGIFHTHFPKGEKLSRNDIQYIQKIMEVMPMSVSELLFPIVLPQEKIVFYVAEKQEEKVVIYKDEFKIIH